MFIDEYQYLFFVDFVLKGNFFVCIHFRGCVSLIKYRSLSLFNYFEVSVFMKCFICLRIFVRQCVGLPLGFQILVLLISIGSFFSKIRNSRILSSLFILQQIRQFFRKSIVDTYTHTNTLTYTHTHIYIYIYIYIHRNWLLLYILII